MLFRGYCVKTSSDGVWVLNFLDQNHQIRMEGRIWIKIVLLQNHQGGHSELTAVELHFFFIWGPMAVASFDLSPLHSLWFPESPAGWTGGTAAILLSCSSAVVLQKSCSSDVTWMSLSSRRGRPRFIFLFFFSPCWGFRMAEPLTFVDERLPPLDRRGST